MNEAADPNHWLHRYGNKEYYKWRALPTPNTSRTPHNGSKQRTIYHRPLGLVESAFDSDGRFFEGRADMNMQLDLECKSRLSDEDFRERMLFAWTALRYKHLLLQAKALSREVLGLEVGEGEGREWHFAIDAPRTVQQAVEDAGEHLVFLQDHFSNIDARDFWMHAQNTARVIDPSRALAKLFVLPPEPLPNGNLALKLLIVCSHQICDGMAMSIWLRSFIHYLNLPVPSLRQEVSHLLVPTNLSARLPEAQESMYPPIAGSRARQRWFWLLTRILRHVRRPLPAAFANPLKRTTPMKTSTPLSPVYAPVLDYSVPTQLNTFRCTAKTSHTATKRLHRLCREANTSIGAGCFALAATIQMELHERRHPDIPLDQRKPFITGFPLNPRAFFNHHVDPDSLMLAFSDGICLPFLPSHLPVAGRIKLLARRAHAQLTMFQKRARPGTGGGGAADMASSRGAGRLLPVHYLFSIERWQAKLPASAKARSLDPQGPMYPMRPNTTSQTCGVSSVGSKVSVLKRGMYPLEDVDDGGGGGGWEFRADFRSSDASVRPRDDEFLVGVGGDDESTIGMNASVDGNAIDPALAREFCRRFESILKGEDEGAGEERARL